jgi:hypothetical protein
MGYQDASSPLFFLIAFSIDKAKLRPGNNPSGMSQAHFFQLFKAHLK